MDFIKSKTARGLLLPIEQGDATMVYQATFATCK